MKINHIHKSSSTWAPRVPDQRNMHQRNVVSLIKFATKCGIIDDESRGLTLAGLQ
jgi:hypothetical protein